MCVKLLGEIWIFIIRVRRKIPPNYLETDKTNTIWGFNAYRVVRRCKCKLLHEATASTRLLRTSDRKSITTIDARHSIEYKLTPATRSSSKGLYFLQFVTVWPWPLTFWPNIKWTAIIVMMNCPCGKFGDCSFSRFGFTCGQTDTQTDTDADERFTPRLSSGWATTR